MIKQFMFHAVNTGISVLAESHNEAYQKIKKILKKHDSKSLKIWKRTGAQTQIIKPNDFQDTNTVVHSPIVKIKITENKEAPLAMQYNICKVTQLCRNRGILSKCYMACCHHKGSKFIDSPNNYNPDLSHKNKIILETKPYSSNPVSDHIEWRLCYCPGNSITPFAVWRYDRNDDIYYGGKYYAKIMGAVKAFEN